jgi:type VI secretion system protein
MYHHILKSVRWEVVCCLVLLFGAGSCNTKTQQPLIPEGAKLNLQSIRIAAASNVNNGQPIPLDIIYVYDEQALKRLQGFNSKGWFSVRNTGLIDWNGQAEVQGLKLEPGQQMELTEFPAEVDKTIALALFANYRTPGPHRFFVVGGTKVVIQLDQFGFSVSGE